jgi:glycosyltransferase involved in cell wall biosynthesis
LRANFIYSDLNPCGGGERLTLVTMKSILEMGINIDLTTLEMPNVQKIENAFGRNFALIIKRISKVHVLQHILDEKSIERIMKNGYDIMINTHGDIDPFYNNSLTKNNAITYCHFPTAKYLIDSENNDYLGKHIKIAREAFSKSSCLADNTNEANSNVQRKHDIQNTDDFDRKKYLKWLKDTYEKMMKNTTVITNSEYSRKAIFEAYGIKDAIVLSPPVDVDKFRDSFFSSHSLSTSVNNDGQNERQDFIMVVSRIEPAKKIENAVTLAKLLKDKAIGKGMRIVGNLEPYYYDYYTHIKKKIDEFDLENFITLEINVNLDKMLSLMKKSKVYFHPRPDEHFGISIVEAMSAGLVPIVSDEGGQTEYVPLKYQYHTLEHAAQIIASAILVPSSERIIISNSVQKFSLSNYIKKFQDIVGKVLAKKIKQK